MWCEIFPIRYNRQMQDIAEKSMIRVVLKASPVKDDTEMCGFEMQKLKRIMPRISEKEDS
jgi:hypothetical protein